MCRYLATSLTDQARRFSRRTSKGPLSSRTVTPGRRFLSRVHSTKDTSTTIAGRTHRRVTMSASVIPSTPATATYAVWQIRGMGMSGGET
jgi:hypothetical protein